MTNFRILSILLFLMCAMYLPAQDGLQISKLLNGSLASDPEVSETLISGEHPLIDLSGITLVHSFKGPAVRYASEAASLIKSDTQSATGRNVRYKNGRMTYAFFILPVIEEGDRKINRYLYYLDNSTPKKSGQVMVLYLQGTLSPEKAQRFITQITSK